MHDQLITSADLQSTTPFSWRVIGVVLGWALGAGLIAFLLTWLVLAWPTVTANLQYAMNQPPRQPVGLPAATSNSPVVANDHLVIPQIQVDAPVFYNTAITDAVGQLPSGVVHVTGTAEPGAIGNVFILGHSSGYWWQSGDYTQVFVLLDKLQPGDLIFVNRAGTTYTYRMVSREVVLPTAIEQLNQPNDRRQLSLMTCTPVGTSLKRLIIHADLVQQ